MQLDFPTGEIFPPVYREMFPPPASVLMLQGGEGGRVQWDSASGSDHNSQRANPPPPPIFVVLLFCPLLHVGSTRGLASFLAMYNFGVRGRTKDCYVNYWKILNIQ